MAKTKTEEKQKPLSSILTHNGQIHSLAEVATRYSLDANFKPLAKVERLVVRARTEGLSFSQLTESQQSEYADQVLVDGTVIFGCPLSLNDIHRSAQTKAIKRYLNRQGYNELTLAEVLLAMEFNTHIGHQMPAGIEYEIAPMGAAFFNPNFLSKVLSSYMAIRRLIDRKLQNFLEGIPNND